MIADEQTWGQTDLAAYFVPMTYHPVLGPIVQPLYDNFVKNRAWMPYLGLVPLLLAVWGALRQKRRAAVGGDRVVFVHHGAGPVLAREWRRVDEHSAALRADR